MINGRSSSWRVSTLRNNSPQKPKKRYHIGLAGSLLVLIGVVFCMDSWMRPGIIRLATNIEPRITIFPNNSCRYHGNCREGTVCDPTGFCQPYYQNETSTTPQHINCVQTCLQELTNEELFQYGSIPVVQFTSVAAPPHTGCVIHFQRQRRTPKWTGDPPSQAFRIAQRWRSVIRIDYAGQENHWMVMCRQPCTTSEDCPKGLTCQGRRSDNTKKLQWVRTCQPPQPYVSDMIVVSGCNDYYFHGLQNFAASLHYWAPHRKLVLYNLGMTTDQLTEAQEWPNVLAIRWPKGIPSSYPSHVQDDLSNYAWKSLVINETVHEFKSIFWLDAGATFVGPIEPIEEIVQLHGIFLVKGQDDHMKYRSHPGESFLCQELMYHGMIHQVIKLRLFHFLPSHFTSFLYFLEYRP